MRLGIDAFNLRLGGGVTHLVELLRVAVPSDYGFDKVIVWSGRKTLSLIEDRNWLVKNNQDSLDKSLIYRFFWHRFRLSEQARSAGCNILFVPGGSFEGDFRPFVTMCRNLLPFEWNELRRYGFSWTTLRLLLLYIIQARTFRRADGLIFLTQYARNMVTRKIKNITDKSVLIPHGVNKFFTHPPRQQIPISQYSFAFPFRILYVSIVDVYKHQWHVAEAVGRLRKNGFPIALDLLGPAYEPALGRLRNTLNNVDPTGEFVQYLGPVSYEELPMKYTRADLCLFASSCENMPNILLEGMASGLPIVCSNRGPMPDVLGDTSLYFDPENPDDIARAIQELLQSPMLRFKSAQASFERARIYSWKRCAHDTFMFLAAFANNAAQKGCD